MLFYSLTEENEKNSEEAYDKPCFKYSSGKCSLLNFELYWKQKITFDSIHLAIASLALDGCLSFEEQDKFQKNLEDFEERYLRFFLYSAAKNARIDLKNKNEDDYKKYENSDRLILKISDRLILKILDCLDGNALEMDGDDFFFIIAFFRSFDETEEEKLNTKWGEISSQYQKLYKKVSK